MGVADQEFAVAEIMRVPAGSALRDFPEFPRAGTLVILTPPCKVGERELSGWSAQVNLPRGLPVILDYLFWQVNSRDKIGLLCGNLDETSIPLGTKVRFVKRRS
jgi:hypothetical protein